MDESLSTEEAIQLAFAYGRRDWRWMLSEYDDGGESSNYNGLATTETRCFYYGMRNQGLGLYCQHKIIIRDNGGAESNLF